MTNGAGFCKLSRQNKYMKKLLLFLTLAGGLQFANAQNAHFIIRNGKPTDGTGHQAQTKAIATIIFACLAGVALAHGI